MADSGASRMSEKGFEEDDDREPRLCFFEMLEGLSRDDSDDRELMVMICAFVRK